MAKVKPDGHIWALEFNRYVCFSFRGNRTIFGWDIANSIFDLDKLRSRSWPRSNLRSIDMFAIRFVAIGPFFAEILQIPDLTLENLGQGLDENRPKTNQVIYRSRPTTVPKIKEIQNFVQKLSREQESAAGGGVRIGTKNIKYLCHKWSDLVS